MDVIKNMIKNMVKDATEQGKLKEYWLENWFKPLFDSDTEKRKCYTPLWREMILIKKHHEFVKKIFENIDPHEFWEVYFFDYVYINSKYHNREYLYFYFLANFLPYYREYLIRIKKREKNDKWLDNIESIWEKFKNRIEQVFGYSLVKKKKINWSNWHFKTWHIELMPVQIKIITEILPESIDKTKLLEIIFKYKKATSASDKNQVLFNLQKPMFENIGKKYKGNLLSEEKLTSYWRPRINAIIRHHENDNNQQGKKYELSSEYEKTDEKEKIKMLDELLLFLVVYRTEEIMLEKKAKTI
ncbi:hypothetical protein [Mycoplasma amphoriforme]|uniref:Uncharacterized protein n=1 Tax=Mycoplasma amphoriforme A39 TaxID=572419 RepID=A0A292IH85_9MOLU|nr:unnamed protein product [Mycoplasma amphoriforme A39]